MRVISVDPGYDRIGVAIMDFTDNKELLLHSECITTDKLTSLPERIFLLGTRFEELLQQYSPTALGIETLFFNKNQKTAIGVAQARGTLLYLARTHDCAIYEFGPQEVKVAITGYGKSDKRAVIDMIMRLVPNAPPDALDDEYDAIAVGITCLAHHGRTK